MKKYLSEVKVSLLCFVECLGKSVTYTLALMAFAVSGIFLVLSSLVIDPFMCMAVGKTPVLDCRHLLEEIADRYLL